MKKLKLRKNASSVFVYLDNWLRGIKYSTNARYRHGLRREKEIELT